jgi:hypothetical protein
LPNLVGKVWKEGKLLHPASFARNTEPSLACAAAAVFLAPLCNSSFLQYLHRAGFASFSVLRML